MIPPEIGLKAITKSEPVINEDVEPGVIELYFGKAIGIDDSREHFVNFKLSGSSGNEIINKSGYAKKVCSKGFNIKEFIRPDQKTFSTLMRRHITIDVVEYHLLRSNKAVGQATIKLDDLASKSVLNMTVPLARRGPTLEVTVRVNRSLSVPEYKQITEKIEFLEALLPVFRSPEGHNLTASPQLTQAKSSNPTPVQKQKADSFEEEKKTPTMPSNLTSAEIENPNIIDNLNSYEVLEKESQRLQQSIIQMRSNGHNPQTQINQQRDVMRKKMIIESQVENGIISPGQYKTVLETQINHDMQLATYFRDRGDKEKLLICAERVKIMKGEIAELG